MSLIHLHICIQTGGQGGNKERMYVCANTNVFNIVGENRYVVENDNNYFFVVHSSNQLK